MDIGEVHVDWLAAYTRETRNFGPLAKWLRSSGSISDNLRLILADILEGYLKPSGKRQTRIDAAFPGLLRKEINFWKGEFRLHAGNPTASQRGQVPTFTWDELAPILAFAGYQETPFSVGECGQAAWKVTGWLHGLTRHEVETVVWRKPALARKSKG